MSEEAKRTPDQELRRQFASAVARLQNVAPDKKNQHFRTQYASLGAILDEVRKTFREWNIAVSQRPFFADGMVGVETFVYNTDGAIASMGTTMMPVEKKTAQSYGSALTYAKRYALASICGIAVDEDDDGDAASQPVTRRLEPALAADPELREKKLHADRLTALVHGTKHKNDVLPKLGVKRLSDASVSELKAAHLHFRQLLEADASALHADEDDVQKTELFR